jgi:hypothetical protein
MACKQTRKADGIGTAPAAFAGDTKIGDDAARCGDALGITSPIVKMDEPEIEPRLTALVPLG